MPTELVGARWKILHCTSWPIFRKRESAWLAMLARVSSCTNTFIPCNFRLRSFRWLIMSPKSQVTHPIWVLHLRKLVSFSDSQQKCPHLPHNLPHPVKHHSSSQQSFEWNSKSVCSVSLSTSNWMNRRGPDIASSSTTVLAP